MGRGEYGRSRLGSSTADLFGKHKRNSVVNQKKHCVSLTPQPRHTTSVSHSVSSSSQSHSSGSYSSPSTLLRRLNGRMSDHLNLKGISDHLNLDQCSCGALVNENLLSSLPIAERQQRTVVHIWPFMHLSEPEETNRHTLLHCLFSWEVWHYCLVHYLFFCNFILLQLKSCSMYVPLSSTPQ